MNQVKYPPVDPKSVDGFSREEQKQGYCEHYEGSSRGLMDIFMGTDYTMASKGVPQDAKGGFVGRPHGWER